MFLFLLLLIKVYFHLGNPSFIRSRFFSLKWAVKFRSSFITILGFLAIAFLILLTWYWILLFLSTAWCTIVFILFNRNFILDLEQHFFYMICSWIFKEFSLTYSSLIIIFLITLKFTIILHKNLISL